MLTKGGTEMIPKRFHFYTFSFFMSLLMSGTMSLAMLSIDSTTAAEILSKWPQAWAISMLVAYPVSMLVMPLTTRLVSKLVASN